MFKFLFLFAITVLFAACQGSIPRDDKGREDFQAFYKKFHQDSVFQLERIDFDAISLGKDSAWSEANWVPMQMPNDPSSFVVEFKEQAEDLMQVLVVYDNTLYIDRSFNLTPTKEWIMTSYSGARAFINVPSTPGGEAYKAQKDSLEAAADSLPVKVIQE